MQCTIKKKKFQNYCILKGGRIKQKNNPTKFYQLNKRRFRLNLIVLSLAIWFHNRWFANKDNNKTAIMITIICTYIIYVKARILLSSQQHVLIMHENRWMDESFIYIGKNREKHLPGWLSQPLKRLTSSRGFDILAPAFGLVWISSNHSHAYIGNRLVSIISSRLPWEHL